MALQGNGGSDKTDLIVSKIENGTVIDHIPSESLFRVIQILGLEGMPNRMTFGYNLESKRMGTKGMVKISDKFFLPDEVNRIALVAPHARLNVIRNFNVVEKCTLELPPEIHGIVRCANPKCITNHDEIMPHFHVIGTDPVTLRCHYCEKHMEVLHLEHWEPTK